MNSNIQALSTLLKKRAGEVNSAWNRAKSHCTADGDKGNYVKAFKITLSMLNWFGPIDHLPEKIGDSFNFMGKPAKVINLGNGFTFGISINDIELELPLINLIFTLKHGV